MTKKYQYRYFKVETDPVVIDAVKAWKAAVLWKEPTAIISWCVPDYRGDPGCFMVSGLQSRHPRCPDCNYVFDIEDDEDGVPDKYKRIKE